MSKDAVKAFYDVVVKDQELKKELQTLTAKVSAKEEAVKVLIEFAGKKGFKFSAEDLEEFEKGAQKLSIDELDKVNAAGLRGICVLIGFGYGVTKKGSGTGGMACAVIGVGFGGLHS